MAGSKRSSALLAARAAASKLVDGALELVYPRHCAGCGMSLHDESDCTEFFCAACLKDLPFISAERCLKCGHQLAQYTKTSPRCPSCEGKSLFFKSATAPFRYEGIARELILQLKLGKQTFFALPMSRYLIEHLETHRLPVAVDAVVPVPLHWRRALKRGFNQSQLIAEQVAGHFRLPLQNRCLRRKRATPSQTAAGKQQRMENMRGVFAVRKNARIAGKRLLLIDDVLTTGATCAECSRMLIEGGAKAVYVATVARTMFS